MKSAIIELGKISCDRKNLYKIKLVEGKLLYGEIDFFKKLVEELNNFGKIWMYKI